MFIKLIHNPCLPDPRASDVYNAKFLQFVNVAAYLRADSYGFEGLFVFRIDIIPDGSKRPATPSPPGSPSSVFVSTPNDVDTNTLQFLLNSASAYACPAVGQ